MSYLLNLGIISGSKIFWMPFWTLWKYPEISTSSFWSQHVLLWMWKASPRLLPSSQGVLVGWHQPVFLLLTVHVSRYSGKTAGNYVSLSQHGKVLPHSWTKRPQISVQYYQNKAIQLPCGIEKAVFLWLLLVTIFFPASSHVGPSCKVLRHQFSWKTVTL